ncbi:MAG: hypothetical protein P9E24_06050 [Candidatus Competibacter sp.]|nr:hypothetical protein [Candidatus Competibacter sp.]MDG4584515.1 hypothetical protein [Candidatus Competibacter sp.]
MQAAQLELQFDQVLAVHQRFDQIVAGTGAVAVHQGLDQPVLLQQLDDLSQVILHPVSGFAGNDGIGHGRVAADSGWRDGSQPAMCSRPP